MTAPRTAQQLFDLKGKIALITDDSRGVCLQMAQALGEAGAKVVVSSRRSDDVKYGVTALQDAGIDACWMAADAVNPQDIQRLADETLDRVGDVDILVNGAGVSFGLSEPAAKYPLEAWDKVTNLNVRGYFLLSQAIAKASMIPRKQGCIINVASIPGLRGKPSFMQSIAYNTSKGAVVNFTRALACEWGHLGIRVNAIAPGFFPGRAVASLLAEFFEKEVAAASPLQRLGDDEDLKGLTLLFASEAGKHITGQVMAVDGGVSAVIGG